MRTSLVLMVVAAAWAIPANADEPNFFQPKEVPSDGLVVFVQSCVDSARKAQPAPPLNTVFKYCTCMGDAHMARLAVTSDVTNQCAAFARANANKTTPARGPFHGTLVFNADQVVGAVMGCERTKDAATLPVRTRQRFCSCLVDAMRFERTMLISDASKAKCKVILKKKR